MRLQIRFLDNEIGEHEMKTGRRGARIDIASPPDIDLPKKQSIAATVPKLNLGMLSIEFNLLPIHYWITDGHSKPGRLEK